MGIELLLFMQTFTLKGEFIQLIQLLKVMNWVEHGAMAQWAVEEGLVKYNGEVDYRKRLKVKVGDMVEFDGNKVKII
ncbi:ribosome-associated protein [Sphingobacterium lactis]|uniref:Ribosome-associated protein n=2 Tax=Sphingobacterium lactis TaxID=797291 RepID=A0A1H5Z681_9SPHI|nr:ribosome-associated protein [Sphingobacterium lactis]